MMSLWFKCEKWLKGMPPLSLVELAAALFVLAIIVGFGLKGLVTLLLVCAAIGALVYGGIKAADDAGKID